MISRRTAAFIIFYISIIILILFTYFYVQKYYSHEATHRRSEQLNNAEYKQIFSCTYNFPAVNLTNFKTFKPDAIFSQYPAKF